MLAVDAVVAALHRHPGQHRIVLTSIAFFCNMSRLPENACVFRRRNIYSVLGFADSADPLSGASRRPLLAAQTRTSDKLRRFLYKPYVIRMVPFPGIQIGANERGGCILLSMTTLECQLECQ